MKMTRQPMSGKIHIRNVKTIYPYAWEQLNLFEPIQHKKEHYATLLNLVATGVIDIYQRNNKLSVDDLIDILEEKDRI